VNPGDKAVAVALGFVAGGGWTTAVCLASTNCGAPSPSVRSVTSYRPSSAQSPVMAVLWALSKLGGSTISVVLLAWASAHQRLPLWSKMANLSPPEVPGENPATEDGRFWMGVVVVGVMLAVVGSM
jgi:hypothetical protein